MNLFRFLSSYTSGAASVAAASMFFAERHASGFFMLFLAITAGIFSYILFEYKINKE